MVEKLTAEERRLLQRELHKKDDFMRPSDSCEGMGKAALKIENPRKAYDILDKLKDMGYVTEAWATKGNVPRMGSRAYYRRLEEERLRVLEKDVSEQIRKFWYGVF